MWADILRFIQSKLNRARAALLLCMLMMCTKLRNLHVNFLVLTVI